MKKVLIIIITIAIIISIVLFNNNNNNNDNSDNNETKEIINEIKNEWEDLNYYIKEYEDRYIKYFDEHKDLTKDQVITIVNSNRDKIYFDDSISADTSKGMYTLVNKYYYLDQNYIPDNLVNIDKEYSSKSISLVKDAYDNFVKMASDATLENVYLKITSGYRSYNYQNTLYNNYVLNDGIELADTYSARPGYSEHQLGYSVDLTNKSNASFDEFENTLEYSWLKENAYKYGFILRYPEGMENITGYMYESWHYRYVGLDIAKYIYENNITYEEYYAYFLR